MPLDNTWFAGNQLFAEGRYTEALAQLAPLRADAHGIDPASLAFAVARCLFALHRLDEAEAWFDKAVAFDPGRVDVRWAYAMQCLLRGRFTPGWSHYEQRLELYGAAALHIHPFSAPRWQGEALEGKSILLHAEQGFGEEIMFASMAAEVVARADRCVIACSPALHALFERSFPAATVVALNRGDPASWRGDDPPSWLRQVEPIDYQISSGSLARILRSDASRFSPRAYLQAHPAQVEVWKTRLAERRGPDDQWFVGIAWAGDRAAGSADDPRGLPIHLLRPLARLAGVRLVSLHMADRAPEASGAPDMRVLDCSMHLRDFDDTAALMRACDLVVSIDNAAAHLAGALGLPTLVPLWHGADWRWGLGDRDALWYPDLRIFRQRRPGVWRSAVDALASHVRERFGLAGAEPERAPRSTRPHAAPPAPSGCSLFGEVRLQTESGFMIVAGDAAPPRSEPRGKEPTVASVLGEVVRHLPPQALVLDIGAGIGTQTMALARGVHAIGGRVLAFEAQRRMFYVLASNVAIDSHFNVHCHHAAVGAVARDRATDERREGDPRLVTLDSLALPRVDLVRLAVDGSEAETLEGGRATLRRWMPILCIEQARGSPRLRRILFELGYRVFRLNRAHLICIHPERALIAFAGFEEVMALAGD